MAKYVAGWNMPGCLPEAEPAEFDSFDEAREYIQEEFRRRADDCDSDQDEEHDAYLSGEYDLDNRAGPFTTSEMPNGYVYWVERAK